MNLTFSDFVFACNGCISAEGFLMNGLFKSAARQPDIIPQLRANDDYGDCLIEGTFFNLAMSFVIKQTTLFRNGGSKTEGSLNPTAIIDQYSLIDPACHVLVTVLMVFAFVYWASRKMTIRPKGNKNAL